MDATSGTARCDELMRRGRFVATAHAYMYLRCILDYCYILTIRAICYLYFHSTLSSVYSTVPCKLILHPKDETFGTVPGKETIFSLWQFI